MNDLSAPTTRTAMWRSGVARTRLHLCSAVNAFGIANVYGTKPGATAATTTRRGAPPQ